MKVSVAKVPHKCRKSAAKVPQDLARACSGGGVNMRLRANHAKASCEACGGFTFLEDAIRTAVGRCVIVSHRALSGEDEDARRVRRIISECHAESPGKVVLAMNGHGHSDSVRFCEGVPYYTVNSPNHCWIPFRHSAYPHEDVVRWKEIGHVVAYSGKPLSAIITVSHNGDISVSGMKGGWWRGICPVDISPRLAGYQITPHIEDRNCLVTQQLSERRGTLAGVSD